MSKEVADEYLSSLADLTVNSKPLINMLTMLADENVDHAAAIVQVIENHIEKVSPEIKLPVLYLIDSIIKNVSQVYVPLFTQNIVNIFVSVFEKVDEKTRLNMYKLRQTWGDVFPARKLYVLDLRVKEIDHAWPVTAPTPTSIHFNPKFLGSKTNISDVPTSTQISEPQHSNTTPAVPTVTTSSELHENVLRDQLLTKQKILIQLQQKKLELELMQTKVILEEQQKHANDSNILAGLVRPPVADESVKGLSQRVISKPKSIGLSPSSLSNTKSIKTKIAPATTQIIEAVKSRDPRIARQQLQQTKASEITHKEQEIYNRQLAMLKPPVLEQVVPAAPVQRVLSESNVKGHITINIERNRDREKFDARTKKQVRDRSKPEISPSKSKSLLKDSRNPASRTPKDDNLHSKDLKNTIKSSHVNSSIEKKKSPPKNERSVSPGVTRHGSPKNEAKWSKHSSQKHGRSYSSKSSSPKKASKRYSSSPKSRKVASSKSGSSSPKVRSSYSVDNTEIDSDNSDKNRRKSRKRHRKGDSENSCKYFEITDKSYDVASNSKDRCSSSREDENPVCDSSGSKANAQVPMKQVSDIDQIIDQKSVTLGDTHNKENAENVSDFKLNEDLSSNCKIKDTVKDFKCIKNENSDIDRTLESEKLPSGELLADQPYNPNKHVKSSPSPEPPPPPIISRTEEDSLHGKIDEVEIELSDEDKECKKEKTSFKDLKGVSKGRNYMRRNRESSVSPQKEATGDIDLRISGPPEKQPRLLFEEENIADNEKSLVNASGKDVDFRLLPVGGASPSKKKLTSESIVEQPPKKKPKNEAFDELFGNEDVDLRKITAPNLNPGERLPSPPPPPVISNGPAIPQIASVAPLVVGDGCKEPSSDIEPVPILEDKGDKEINRDNFDSNRGRHRRSWADIKTKPEADVRPVSLSSQLDMQVDLRKDAFSLFDTTEKGSKKHFRDRMSHRGELDRLGRPLLYNKLPNDPRARKESLGILDARDTDMRRFGGLTERDIDTNINVNMIVAQAEDQVRNGTMSMHEYNELIKQVIHVNEKQKLREAQNKGRQEIRRSQHHQRGRRSPNRYGSHNRDSPPFRHDDDRRERRHFNDIDERLPIPWRSLQRNDSSGVYGKLPFGPGRSPFEMGPLDRRQFDDRSMKPDIWEDDQRFKQLSVMDEAENVMNRTRDLINSERTHDCVDVPPADPTVLERIAKDPMKSISIDGTARDIRFYSDTAVVMLSWDDPKEICFEDGIRRIAIGDINITCALNDTYRIFMINGKTHRIRLGAPTRELYIDGDFYEAHFGGPPVPVQIDGLQYLVQVEGPPPQVKIGKNRTDLVCGRINMIVDATAMLPLFLDSKPQRFDLRSRPYVFRFVNSLKTLLVNEVPLDIQFGGVCRQICGYGNLHFLRLSMLPNGIIPGCVQILDMENIGLPAMSSALENPLGDASSPSLSNLQIQGTNGSTAISDGGQLSTARNFVSGGSLDILTSLMSGAASSEQAVGFNYQVEQKEPQVPQSVNVPTETSSTQPQGSGIPFLGNTLNINDLFQRLVASGIVQTAANMNTNKPESEDESPVNTVDFANPNSLRERNQAAINSLYSGIQCSSCGVRFSPEETVKYSRHLDWHFRQNRREKDTAWKMRSRKWYYDVSDWIQFEEIEDLEERAQSWFDTETTSAADDQEQDIIKSVPAPQGEEVTRCEMCRDQFDTYYNEEKEEWHLKPCIIVEDKYYHPLCYEDLMNMPEDSLIINKNSDNSVSVNDETKLQTPADEEVKMEITVDEDEGNKFNEELETEMKDCTVSSDEIPEEILKTESTVFDELFKTDDAQIEPEDPDPVVRLLLSELINCVVFKEEIDLDDFQDQNKEEEIEVLENVPVEQKKNIIAVDLIEKLDEEEDEVVYRRKSPSPVTFIPTIKIKQEPVDEMESPVAVVDQTYTNVVSTIDGNVEMIDTPQIASAGPSKIKINFNKPIATDNIGTTQKVLIKDPSDTSPEEMDPEPLPMKPKKPRIAERDMTVYLPCVKGTEVSGLCTIM